MAQARSRHGALPCSCGGSLAFPLPLVLLLPCTILRLLLFRRWLLKLLLPLLPLRLLWLLRMSLPL